MKHQIVLSVLLASFSIFSCAQETVQPELRPVPAERIHTHILPAENTAVVTFESRNVTGPCDMGLWIDGKLAAVFHAHETWQIPLAEGERELRLSWAPVEEEKRKAVQKEKGKYCLKNHPEQQGTVRKIRVAKNIPRTFVLRTNRGYLFKIMPKEEEKVSSRVLQSF